MNTRAQISLRLMQQLVEAKDVLVLSQVGFWTAAHYDPEQKLLHPDVNGKTVKDDEGYTETIDPRKCACWIDAKELSLSAAHLFPSLLSVKLPCP